MAHWPAVKLKEVAPEVKDVPLRIENVLVDVREVVTVPEPPAAIEKVKLEPQPLVLWSGSVTAEDVPFVSIISLKRS